jgi:hypothetical protein
MPDGHENPSRIAELGEILWGHIQQLDKYRHMRKRQPLTTKLRVAHAISQLSASYLKVVEADAALHAVPELQTQLQEVLRTSRNGHHHPAAAVGLN